MKLNPSQPYNNDSYAELLVFDAFRKITMPEAICFNSLHLVSHRQKIMSEIDFVIVCAKGIFVFEVKGGRVFQENGRWFSRSKQKTHHIDNPFNQSRSALFSLLDSLKIKGVIRSNTPIGYGVLLPNTVNLPVSLEYDSRMLGTKNNLKGFGTWLNSFIDYWVDKVELPTLLNSDDISKIANFLRPGTLDVLKQQSDELDYLNVKQKQVVTAFQLGKRIICEGAAGTGKTHIISLLIKHFVSRNQNILVLCESRWLKGYLKSELSGFNIVVATIDSLVVESRRAFISHYDIVIVDEAQDLYHEHAVDLLDCYLKGGISHGRWIFFQDLINQSDFFNQPDTRLVNHIKKISEVRLSLDVAYRYSRVTLNYLNKLLGSDKIDTKKIQGPEISEFKPHDEVNEIIKVEEAIVSAISNGYIYSDITIISNETFSNSVVSKLPQHILKYINQLDDFNIRSFPLEGISFSQLHHFKGLENKIVILLDFDERTFKNTSRAYVALTRASERLFIVFSSAEQEGSFEEQSSVEFGKLDSLNGDVSKANWQEVLDLTFLTDECEYLMEKNIPSPICGYELTVNDMVVAEVELAWPSSKVCIFGDEAESGVIEKFSSAGWCSYQAPLDESEFTQITKTVIS